MQNLDDVFKLLRDAESAIRRSGWKGGDDFRPSEARRIAERFEAGDFQKALAVIKAHQRGAPCAMPDDVKAALDGLDASFYRAWVAAAARQELTGYITGNVKPALLVKVIEWARQNATAPAPRITEQDALLFQTEFKKIMNDMGEDDFYFIDGEPVPAAICGESTPLIIDITWKVFKAAKLNNNPTTQE